jgi:hypothetical protein
MKKKEDKTYICKGCGECVSEIIKCDGLCIKCYRKQPRMIEKIRASHKNSRIKTEEAREKAGLCLKCGGSKETGFLHCDKCRDKSKAQQRQDRDKRRALRLEVGACVVCGKRPAADGRVACETCWKAKRYVAENIKEIRL